MSNIANVATIGFTKTTAERFFGRLAQADVRLLIDVRLNNTSQLSGFAKAADLAYFLTEIGGIRYTHQPDLAPTEKILKDYKKGEIDWGKYEDMFMTLMQKRKIEERFKADMFDGSCLLCSEDKPHNCHRKLVCDYLNAKWGATLRVRHL